MEPGGRARRTTPTVDCADDSRTPGPARSPPITGPLATVEGVVTVRGRLPVTVPGPGTDLGPWRVAATSRHLGRGDCAVGASAGMGSHLLRGWGWGQGEGVGVGPLILTPFLLEHHHDSEGACAFES